MDYSVVMEWDNPRSSDAVRALQTVGIVAEQMREQPGGGELLVVFAQDAFDGDTLRPEFEKHVQGIEWRLIPTSDRRYYQLKNEGVRNASGRVVLFMDSDILPEPGCLGAMLKLFEDESVDCVRANTYLEHATLYEQILALTWTFPLRAGPEATVRPIHGFVAGLVAAPREVWLRFPFNSEKIRYRGMCVDVARRMQKAGIRIQLQPDAKGAHPPPRGPRGFAARALTEGRDRFFRLRATRGRLRSLFRLWAWFWRRATGGNLRILRLHDQVGMKASGVPAAWVINTSYFGLGCAAGSFMFLRPSLVEASLREQRQEESPAVR